MFFFYNVCFTKCEKLSFSLPIFGQNLVDVQNHCKIGISALFFRSREGKGNAIFKGYLKGQVKVISGAKFGAT